MQAVVSGGARADKIAHRCKNFEEKKKDVVSRENQEIRGGIMADLLETARYTANTGKTPARRPAEYTMISKVETSSAQKALDVGGSKAESRKSVPYASESTKYDILCVSMIGWRRSHTHPRGASRGPLSLSVCGSASEGCFKGKKVRSYRDATHDGSKLIKYRQEAIRWFFLITAYTLGAS